MRHQNKRGHLVSKLSVLNQVLSRKLPEVEEHPTSDPKVLHEELD